MTFLKQMPFHPLKFGCRLLTLAIVAAIFTPLANAQAPSAKIALVFSLTGAGETFGGPALDGARLALEEANAGRTTPKIAIEIEDDASDPDKGRDIAHKIINGDALLVVGPATTTMALAVSGPYAEAGVACIGPTTTGDSVTESPTFFRAVFSTSQGGEALANYLRYILGGTQAVVIYKDDGYGQPFAAGFRRGAERLGITTKYLPYKSLAEAEENARQAAADPAQPAVILGSISENVPILTVLRRSGAKGAILGSNGIAGDFFSAAFADQPEERARPGFFTNGVYAATPLLFDSANAETVAFVQRFRNRFGKDPSYITVQGYEAMRIAIAAARAAVADPGTGSLKARREAARGYLKSLDGPAHAVAGLDGPLWFTPDRGRQQVPRIGRFHGVQLESAPGQLVPVRHPDASEIAGGTVVDIGDNRFARRQQVVYTGLFLNEISRVDIAQSTFTADFYLWMRFARGADTGIAVPTDIDFPNLVRGSFDARRTAAQGDLDDGTTYRLWQVRGDFKNDFDLHRYPADRQTLAIRFFNARAASDRIVYVLDQRSFANAAAGAGSADDEATAVAPPPNDDRFGGAVAPAAFRNLTQWIAMRAQQRRDQLVTESALGDPRLVGLERIRELSGFNFAIELRRRIGTTLAKTLLPLGLMALIMFASLFFPNALVKEKVTVAITGALSGAVLLSAINSQLGNVGYVIAVEYGFYVFFALCLLCIVAVLAAERLRVAGRGPAAQAVELSSRLLFVVGLLGTIAAGWYAVSQG
jgi:ABC-type branched-subunit amino acid transport system substrate-binding protein